MLEMNRDEINKVFQDGMSGKLAQNNVTITSQIKHTPVIITTI
jgi:hypothetical protein